MNRMEEIIDPKPKKPQPNKVKGMIFVLVSWVFFTLVIALSKITTEKIPIPMVLLFQYGIGMFFILPMTLKNGKKSLHMSKIGVIFLRSVSGFLGYAFIYLAVQRTSLVNVVLLSNSAPLFIPLIIWLWKKVHIGKQLWVGIAIGFVGIGFILKPNQEIVNIGTLFALGSAVCTSFSMIAQRRLAKSESVFTSIFYYFLISTVLCIPFVVDSWQPIDRQVLWMLIAIAILFTFGQMLFLSSLKYEKPSFLSSFNYSAVIYGAILEWFLWGQYPDWITLIGICIVICGGIITITHTTGKGITRGAGQDQSTR